MTGHVLQLLLQFVYSGNVTVMRDVTELTDVIRAADQLQLTHITGTCEDLLREIQGNTTTGEEDDRTSRGISDDLRVRMSLSDIKESHYNFGGQKPFSLVSYVYILHLVKYCLYNILV